MYNILQDAQSLSPSFVIGWPKKKLQITFSTCIFENETENKFWFQK